MKLPDFWSRRFQTSAFVAALLFVFISLALECWGLERLSRASDTAHDGELALANAADDMRENVLELRRYEKDVFMNVGTEELVREYRAKWDLAFQDLRFDLVQARRAGSTSQDARLQQVVDRIADYRVAFARIYELVLDGTIRTTQQANQAMHPFKDSVREAEIILAELGSSHRAPPSQLAPAVTVQWLELAATLLSFLTLAAIFSFWVRRVPVVNPA